MERPCVIQMDRKVDERFISNTAVGLKSPRTRYESSARVMQVLSISPNARKARQVAQYRKAQDAPTAIFSFHTASRRVALHNCARLPCQRPSIAPVGSVMMPSRPAPLTSY